MKKHKITFWIVTTLLFLFEGVMPLATLLFAPDLVAAGVVHLDYPEYFAYTLIAFKILGAIALMIPRLPRPVKEWTYAGFGFNFICAAISHFAVDGPVGDSFFPFIILALLVVSYITYFKAYGTGKELAMAH